MNVSLSSTYYVSSYVTLSGTQVFEGGTVIKFTNSVNAMLYLGSTTLVLKTSPYRMAVFTSKDDNSVGDIITGSTGTPTNTGAIFLREADGPYKYMRFSYAGTAISGFIDGGIWHCQFVSCGTGVLADDTDTPLHNVLFSNCGTAVGNNYGDPLYGEHVTADRVTTLWQNSFYSAKLTNSILTAVTNIGTNVSLYSCMTNSSGSGIYQTVGGASYYLADGSTNRNSGATNINATLAADLRRKTTYPPIVLTNNLTIDTTLSPQAQRDTDALESWMAL